MRFAIASYEASSPHDRLVEIVERKGLGHPDSICDALAEDSTRHWLGPHLRALDA